MNLRILTFIIVLLLIVAVTLGFTKPTEDDAIVTSYTVDTVEKNGMIYMIISRTHVNDGFRVVNVTKDKAELNYYNRN